MHDSCGLAFSLMPPLRSKLAHRAPTSFTSANVRFPVGSAFNRAKHSCGPDACFFSQGRGY